ncbi:hypothetical protein CB1_42 [Pectobacterium phage vB_PatP_CB1]|uniref:Uncharacterized protein n=2 Tax=Cbunavirus TaxID=2842586 RepID=A0A2P0PAS0_9CAUD|nr:hypothetical protein HWB08_gp42 [Pectobacterium phage vB_PatP_CB1]YP_009832373.1 hypothetical protein HWB09_gp044 [Pectobacterium phage vB_PatP_CB4]AQT27886.1 hypothetical protein CB4_044 [Pectobacterium phage vB_PatP_CB4]ARB11769.1 hypothetical protein CB1_42 [Pectobacterium phage vB_PatP_CB1]
MTTETIVKVGDYEVSHTNGTHFVARRNGQLWRDLTGDNLVLALVSRIDQLEKAFTQPTPDMVQAGLAEVQRIADEWDEDWGFQLSDLSDDRASDMAVFVLQAMAGKLPKAGE